MGLTRLSRGPASDAGKYPRAPAFMGLRSGILSSNPQRKEPKRSAAERKALARYYERRRLKKQRENIEIIPNGDI